MVRLRHVDCTVCPNGSSSWPVAVVEGYWHRPNFAASSSRNVFFRPFGQGKRGETKRFCSCYTATFGLWLEEDPLGHTVRTTFDWMCKTVLLNNGLKLRAFMCSALIYTRDGKDLVVASSSKVDGGRGLGIFLLTLFCVCSVLKLFTTLILMVKISRVK